MGTAQKFLRRREVQEIVGLKRTAIYDRIAAGQFPRPVQLGSRRSVAWVEAEIIEWQRDRVAERDGARSPRRRRSA